MSNTLKFGNGQFATKKGSTLAYNDTNGNFKPLPFTFDRAGSATRVNKEGLIEVVSNNEPRIDFKDNTKGSLLLEPQKTNLVSYSEDFSNAAWTKSNSSITSNSVISPDGTLNADKLVVSTSSGYISGTFISSGNTDVTVSFFVKSDTLSNFNFTEAFYFGTVTNFDLSNGTTDNGKIENYGNGWHRCSKTYTYASGQQIVAIQIKTGTTGSLYIFGGQYEQGSYATSYIPTNGSVVTRSADSTSQTVPDGIYGTNEVTFVIDFEINDATPSYSNIFNTNKNTVSSFGITREDSSGFLKPFLFDGGINVGDMTSTSRFLNGVRGKFAVGFKSGDSALAVKGIVEDTNSATFSNFNVNEIHLNDLVTYFGYNTNLRIYDFKLYNTRLSNAELQALTTI